VNELAQRAVAHSELAGQVGLLAPIDDRPEERRALTIGERRYSAQGLTEHGPGLEVLLRIMAASHPLAEQGLPGRPAAELVDGGVVRNSVKPRADLDHFGTCAQCRPGVQEGLLHRILGLRVVHQPPAVAPQLAPVALAEGLEGEHMPIGGQGQQPPV
jgi:hypothetical protein